MTGYILWSIAIITALVVNFGGLMLWYEAIDEYRMTAQKLLVIMLTIISLGCWLGALIYSVERDTSPPSGVTEWKGGAGPDTVCWYADKDNPDQVIMAGKTPIVIPDDGTTRYTWCSMDGTEIPEGAR